MASDNQTYLKLTDGYLTIDTLKSQGINRGLVINIGGVPQLHINPAQTFTGLGNGVLGVGNDGYLYFTTVGGSGSPTGPAGGDLFGAYPNPRVGGLQNNALPSLTSGYLNWTGSAFAYTPLPASFPPSGAAGGDLSGTYPNPTVAKINGITLSGTPSTSQVLTATSSSAAHWATPAAGFVAAGDLSGSATNQTVIGIQTIPVKSGTPSDGQTFIYSSADGEWEAQSTFTGFGSSGSWTCPNGIAHVLIIACGGGGGGASSVSNTAGGGGGGGAFEIKNVVAVTAGTSYTITIGGGGNGGATGNGHSGNTGGNTTFANGGTVLVQANGAGGGSAAAGGAGGTYSVAGSSATYNAGGAGGSGAASGSAGNTNFCNQANAGGNGGANTGGAGGGGGGGAGPQGVGGNGGIGTGLSGGSPAASGSGAGGGGGGGQTSGTGGNGGSGYLYIIY